MTRRRASQGILLMVKTCCTHMHLFTMLALAMRPQVPVIGCSSYVRNANEVMQLT